jgi:hypothetical protein
LKTGILEFKVKNLMLFLVLYKFQHLERKELQNNSYVHRILGVATFQQVSPVIWNPDRQNLLEIPTSKNMDKNNKIKTRNLKKILSQGRKTVVIVSQ